MVAKELRDTWWKVLLLAVPVVLAVPTLPSYESATKIQERFSAEIATEQVSGMYTGGLWALGLLAVLLGGVLVSAEASRNTIFLLLSKPVSRNRLLLTKYAVCAGALLVAAILGHVLVFVVAVFAKGYPLGLFNLGGMTLSTVLLWLASLLILGLAMCSSVLFRSPLVSLVAAYLAVFAALMAIILTIGLLGSYVSEQTWDTLSKAGARAWPLITFSSPSLYTGHSLGISNLLVWLIAAAIPLLVALRLFQRRSY